MALVPDINGVCKVLGTLEMTANPTNPASTRIARLANSWSYIALVLLAGDARVRDDLIVEVGRERAVGDQQLEQRSEVLGVQLAGVLGHGCGQVQRRADGHAVLDDGLARLGELPVPAGLAGEIDDDAAGLHAFDRGGGHQPRRGPARYQRGGDHYVEPLDGLFQLLLLLGLFLVGELTRITALTGGFDTEVQPLSTHRPHSVC